MQTIPPICCVSCRWSSNTVPWLGLIHESLRYDRQLSRDSLQVGVSRPGPVVWDRDSPCLNIDDCFMKHMHGVPGWRNPRECPLWAGMKSERSKPKVSGRLPRQKDLF